MLSTYVKIMGTCAMKVRGSLRHSASQSGQAMLIVIAALALMATIPVVVITTTVNQLPLTTANLNWNSAYEAAQAGVNEYVQQLDANQNFAQWTQGRTVCNAGVTLNPPNDQAFCGWVQVSNNPNEWYEFALPSANSGSLTLIVSGKGGSPPRAVVRTFRYTLVPTSALDYTYWSNYESIDPALNSNDGLNCTQAYYPSSPQSCWVVFASGDVLNGPVFTNDTIHVCGNPTFSAPVKSGAPSLNPPEPMYISDGTCTGAPPTGSGWPPTATSTQPLPSTSAAASAAQNVGCYISGGTLLSPTPTSVSMSLSTSPAINPSTTQITWSGSGANVDNASGNPNNANCGNNGGGTITLSNLTNRGAGLIFVNGNVTINSGSNSDMGFLTIVAGGDPGNKSYGNITIKGSIMYPSTDIQFSSGSPQSDPSDALGLVAQNFIQIPRGLGSLTIDAGILALSDSFYVQNWGQNGVEGTLNVFGAIAQDFRGPVGTTGPTGYVKNYNYDNSLLVLWPPYFLAWSSATWNMTSYTEIQPGSANEALPGT